MTPEAFQAITNVPRGTMDRLHRYAALLAAWQERLNLVAPSTLPLIWERHFLDSAQLAFHVEAGRRWLDFGSGGGFPGLVLATMDWGPVTLVEATAKKCRFLEAVAAELGLTHVRVRNARVEALPPAMAEVVTARATAPLATLFDWSVRHGGPNARWVFPKGRSWATEVEAARAAFRFDLDVAESRTDREARILLVTNLRRAKH